MAYLNNAAKRFRLGLVSGNPFTSFGLEWCARCQMEVDTDTEAVHHEHTYGFKRWCRRCGKVLKFGLYDNVILLSGQPMPPARLEWATTPAQDRRGPTRRR